MKNLGILVNNLTPCEFSHTLITEMNKLIYDYNIIVFYLSHILPPVKPRFALMEMKEAFNYDGTILSTNLDTTQKLLNCVGQKRRILYMWEPEWCGLRPINFSFLHSIYCHHLLELAVNTQPLYDLIKNCWQSPTSIIEKWNASQIVSLVEGNNHV